MTTAIDKPQNDRPVALVTGSGARAHWAGDRADAGRARFSPGDPCEQVHYGGRELAVEISIAGSESMAVTADVRQ